MVNEKPSILQACAVPYRDGSDGEPEFCLITSSGRGDWVFPKGVIEPDETLKMTALKEAEEEAGLLGEVEGKPLGQYDYRKWGTTLRVTAFLMHVTGVEDEWDESDVRRRCWCSVKKARSKIQRDAILELLDKAITRLGAVSRQ